MSYVSPETPFDPVDKPLCILLDSNNSSNYSAADLEFLFRQADGKAVSIISTNKKGDAFCNIIRINLSQSSRLLLST